MSDKSEIIRFARYRKSTGVATWDDGIRATEATVQSATTVTTVLTELKSIPGNQGDQHLIAPSNIVGCKKEIKKVEIGYS